MMAPEVLVFMPDGDVTLRLIRHVMKDVDPPAPRSLDITASELPSPSLEQSRGRAKASDVEAAPEPATALGESVVYFAPDPPDTDDGPFYPPPPRTRRDSDNYLGRNRSTSPPASFWASLKRQQATVGESIEAEQQVPQEAPMKAENITLSSHEVHCVVSSKHMMHASENFQVLLSGNSYEGVTFRRNGHVSIPLSADFDAMIVLLNIIHGASRKVPRQTSFEVLKKLAVLVCELGMLDTVQFFSDTWIDNFQRLGLPTSYNENIPSLIYIFWVFDRASEFKDMSRIAQRECDENLQNNVGDVPIPHIILGKSNLNHI
jgi:hypothetical protein